jgi:hypothetical protein
VFGFKSLKTWKDVIRIIDPKTVISWHRQEFRLYWKWKDHHIFYGIQHLQKVLAEYARYYNQSRTHLSLDKDAPEPRPITKSGRILETAMASGLHHRYERIVA